MLIKISNLSFSYNKKQPRNILESVNLTFQSGTINVLLGLNGSGKTTLIKLLVGLEKPTSGYIQYGELDLQKIKIRERAKLFSYVPQKSLIINDIPVMQYLSYGTTNTLAFYDKPGKKEIERVKQVASLLNISHLLDKNLCDISGGELQIVLIANALIQNTEVIVLDEPTSALDIKNQYLVLSLLKKIASQGKTIIISSHNPNHALFLKARTILINQAGIYLDGPASEIVKIEKLQPIYGDKVCVSKKLGYEEISFTE